MRSEVMSGVWKGRNLANYKLQHQEKHPDIMNARTLTQARKIAFGAKPKSFSCKCGQEKCRRATMGKGHC